MSHSPSGMSPLPRTAEARCECGANRLELSRRPLLRAICHCRICQDFNDASHADLLLFRKSDVRTSKTQRVVFNSYKWPPIVQRGRCSECGKPVIEHLQLPLFPKMAFVPTANVTGEESIPDPALHMFYHRRVGDVDDQVPKRSGYLASEFAFIRAMISALYRVEQ